MAVAIAIAIAIAGTERHSGVVGLSAAPQEQGSVGSRMPAEKARQFETGISGRAENRGLKSARHQISFSSNRSARFPHFPL